jgi:small subunit ribosomal protein S6
VRSVQILGDRILTKKLMGKDRARHIIGRFVSILYDGNPEMYLKVVNLIIYLN